MREYRFTITEHERNRFWIVLSSERRTITLYDDADFFRVGESELARAAVDSRQSS